MGPRAAGEVAAGAADAQGRAERLHRRRCWTAAVRRRRDPAVLHERGGAGGPGCLPQPACSRLLQVPAPPVTGAGCQVDGGHRELLAGLLPTLRAFAIPMRTRFRGITVREGALIEGPAGWGEVSPFAEYGPPECAPWLASALVAACSRWPAPVRDRGGVNLTVPAARPDPAREIVTRSR